MTGITTFLERIAQRRNSFVLFEDRVYDISESPSRDSRLSIRGNDFSLNPSMTLSDFERLDEDVQRQQIDDYCASYIRDKVKEEMKANDVLKRERARINALNFIMVDFLPFLLSKKYGTMSLLMEDVEDQSSFEILDPVQKARDEISERLSRDFGQYDGEKKNTAELSTVACKTTLFDRS